MDLKYLNVSVIEDRIYEILNEVKSEYTKYVDDYPEGEEEEFESLLYQYADKIIGIFFKGDIGGDYDIVAAHFIEKWMDENLHPKKPWREEGYVRPPVEEIGDDDEEDDEEDDEGEEEEE